MIPLWLVAQGWLAFLFPAGPVPGLTRSVHWIRQHDCERITKAEAARQYPGRLPPPTAEEDGLVEVVVCTERALRDGLRSPGEEAILRRLDASVEEWVQVSEPYVPELREHRWLVEVFTPSPEVASKVSFALKNELLTSGRMVSDRVPLLSAEDVEVLSRMHPDIAYPYACQRYAETGALQPDDVLLAVVRRDPRETILHAGLCVEGGWAWLK